MATATTISYGTYTFPNTFQESSRTTKLALDKKHVAFNWGDHAPGNTSLGAREIVVKGPVGSLITSPAQGNLVLASAIDLEAERRILAGLQVGGRQALQFGTQQYCMAFLEEFDVKMWQDAFGARYADWQLKFWADDPRYYSIANNSSTFTTNDSNPHSVTSATVGNVRTYPVFTFTGLSAAGTVSCTAPFVGVKFSVVSNLYMQTTFSQLTLNGGDTLVVTCDPRPNFRSIAAVYTPSGSNTPINALQYTQVADWVNTWDFKEWLPFVDPGIPTLQLVWGAGSVAGGGFSINIQYQDRWI